MILIYADYTVQSLPLECWYSQPCHTVSVLLCVTYVFMPKSTWFSSMSAILYFPE